MLGYIRKKETPQAQKRHSLKGYPGQGKRQVPVALPFNPSGHCGNGMMKKNLLKFYQDNIHPSEELDNWMEPEGYEMLKGASSEAFGELQALCSSNEDKMIRVLFLFLMIPIDRRLEKFRKEEGRTGKKDFNQRRRREKQRLIKVTAEQKIMTNPEIDKVTLKKEIYKEILKAKHIFSKKLPQGTKENIYFNQTLTEIFSICREGSDLTNHIIFKLISYFLASLHIKNSKDNDYTTKEIRAIIERSLPTSST